jgi:hypothetical protein
MAANIPIWPGSSSFFPGSGQTPFAFYDTDVDFAAEADQVADWCAKRLGYPIVDVELQDINFYAAFEEAVSEYGTQVNMYNARDNMINVYGTSTDGGSLTGQAIQPSFTALTDLASSYGQAAGIGGNHTFYTGSIDMVSGKQIYDFTDTDLVSFESGSPGIDAIEIRRIYHEAPPAIVRYFDPFIGTGLGSQQLLAEFGYGNYSPGVSFMMMPIYYDVLRLQAIEFNDQIRKSAFSFELSGNRIRFFPIPNGRNFTKVRFDYYLKSDINNPLNSPETGNGGGTGTSVSDLSNIPYDNVTYANLNDISKQWIRRYALACVKEMLGYVRGKYSSIPIPNADITLNAADLLSQGQSEKDSLINELTQMLDSMSRQAQLERKAAEASALSSQFNAIPLKIYIG